MVAALRHLVWRCRWRPRLWRGVFVHGGGSEHERGGGVLFGAARQTGVRRAGVRGAVAIAQADPTTGSNFDAEQYTTYGTSEGLFAGAGAHATWISVRDAQNEDYYRREMSGRDILNCFGEPAGEHGRRHDEIFRLHSTLNAAASGGKPVKLIAAREKFTRGSTAEARGTPF